MTDDLFNRLRTLGAAGPDSPPPTADLIRRGRGKLRTRRVSAAGAVLTVAAVATGWTLAGPSPAKTTPAQSAQSAQSPAAPVSLALAAQTSEAVPYRLTMNITYSAPDVKPLKMEGGFDPGTGDAYMRDLANRKFIEERAVGGHCYVFTGKEWQRLDDGCFKAGVGTKAGYVRDPKGLLEELKTAGDTQYAGRADGVDTWTFTAEDPRDRVTLRYTGTVKVEVATSRVLAVDFTESIPGSPVTSTIAVSYHDYGKPLVVKVP